MFRNLTPRPLVLTSIDENGGVDDYEELLPFGKDADAPITADDTMDLTEPGSAFTFSIDELDLIDSKDKLSEVVGGYRPTKICKPTDIHVVSITERSKIDPPQEGRPRIKDRYGDDEYDGQYDVNVKLASYSEGLGQIWNSDTAQEKYDAGEMKSEEDNGDFVRVCVRNCTPTKKVVMAWINDEEGAPENYDKLKAKAKEDDPITEDDRVVQTYLHHTFAFGICKDMDEAEENGTFDKVIGGYKPLEIGCEEGIHLVTIHQSKESKNKYEIKVRLCDVDPEPIEADKKKYKEEVIGGWPCMTEKKWHGGDKELKKVLNKHMEAAVGFLPEHAREALRKDTPFYINKSMEYGPEVAPVIGEGMEYHPSEEWLESVGMSVDKAKAIEMYEAAEYFEDVEVWGTGGSLLHELSHAYHDKCLEDGLDNKEILACYRAAMKEGLYDKIKTREGKDDSGNEQYEEERGYHCKDESEYFAELSAAFLGGLNKDEEYNKNQPFNRHEIKTFDPRAYAMLQKLWKVDCDGEEEKKE